MIDEDEEYGLRCTVGQLESERDGYAGEFTRISLEVGLLRQKNAELLRANARLRECLQDLAEHIREDDGFGLDYGWMLDHMREVGVEP